MSEPAAARLKVGEFSRLCQVPVKTLRYYDEIGLFAPSEIDRFTSYRYYTLDQLPRIHRIMALKELGLSLDEIRQLLNSEFTPGEIRALFVQKEAEVQRRIQEEQERLALVKFHLHEIEQEAAMPALPIVAKTVDAFPALTYRAIFPAQPDIDRVGIAIQKAVMTGALKPAALPMGIAYLDEFRRHDLDYEFVLPLDPSTDLANVRPVPLEGGAVLCPREVPALALAATYLFQGDYDGLNHAGVALQRWAVENGYALGGEMRFIHFRGPMHGVAPDQYLTELQHPIARAELS